MCYRAGKYTVCRRIRASFSPEILQAGAVKGVSFFAFSFFAVSFFAVSFFFALACQRIFIKTGSIENRCVIGPETILFAGASVHLSARKFYRLRKGSV